MIKTNSIANKFRLSYLIFTILLCTGFIGIFNIAENQVEKQLAKGRLLQELQFNISQNSHPNSNDSPPNIASHTSSGINIYPYQAAPKSLQQLATTEVQEIEFQQNDKDSELYFFKYHYQGKDYILSYLENGNLNMTDYPVLTMFEELESIFYDALFGILAVSVLIALLFSYLSSKMIVKPILDLKLAVETDRHHLSDLPHLPLELEVLAQTIDEKNQKLSGYLAREQLFTGDVSHELRTPLTIIMGASEVLESQLESNSKSLEFARRISSTAKDTSDIISALLLLSRSPEALDAPRTSINEIINKEINRLGYLLRLKPVTYHIAADQEYFVFARPELLKMAIGNLIKNAFQYTEEGSIEIRIDAQKITIQDSGLSIPENMMSVVYERFGRIEPQGIKVEGTGLGLSIVQRIMSHLGWELTYHSNALGGSTFSIYYSQTPIKHKSRTHA